MVALVAGVLLAGCGSAEPAPMSPRPESSTTRSGPPAELVAWVDGVCQVERASLWNPPPPVDANAVTEADRPAVVAYLTAGRDHFTQLAAKLDALPAAPVDGGDEVVANMRSKVNALATQLGEYAQNASVFPPRGVAAAYRLGLVDIAAWSYGDPSLADLEKKNPLVAEARERTQTC